MACERVTGTTALQRQRTAAEFPEQSRTARNRRLDLLRKIRQKNRPAAQLHENAQPRRQKPKQGSDKWRMTSREKIDEAAEFRLRMNNESR